MNKFILLVEDNPDDEALTLRTVRKITPLLVTVIRDGAETLDFLFCSGNYKERKPWAPTLIILDLKLPKLSGLDALRRIRQDARTCHVPVIIFTSSTEEQDILNSYKLGANSYISKPVDFTRYRDSLKQVVEYWLNLTKLPTAC